MEKRIDRFALLEALGVRIVEDGKYEALAVGPGQRVEWRAVRTPGDGEGLSFPSGFGQLPRKECPEPVDAGEGLSLHSTDQFREDGK